MRILIGENRKGMQQADLLAERIQSSYPFRPDLLDWPRWGSLQLSTPVEPYSFWRVQFMPAPSDTSL